ncbi:MAG: RHS repeat protein, partial [bacterium]|nr:RHS repeat protein [bacterium]
MTQTEDENGNLTDFTYDDLGRFTQAVNPDGRRKDVEY